jgi:hypothetical protein
MAATLHCVGLNTQFNAQAPWSSMREEKNALVDLQGCVPARPRFPPVCAMQPAGSLGNRYSLQVKLNKGERCAPALGVAVRPRAWCCCGINQNPTGFAFAELDHPPAARLIAGSHG